MRSWLWGLVLIGAGMGCGTGAASAPAVSAPAEETRPALWALAPASAVAGVVIADGAGAELVELATALDERTTTMPAVRALWDAAAGEASAWLGMDVREPAALAAAGVDLRQGAALFLSPGDRFVAVVPARLEAPVLGRLRLRHCADRGGRTVCASDPALLAEVVSEGEAALAEAVASLPDELRGDVEIYARPRALPKDLIDSFRQVRGAVASLRVDGATVRARGWLWAEPRASDLADFAGVPLTLRESLPEAAAPEGLLHLRLFPLVLMREVERGIDIGGQDLRDDLLASATGEVLIRAGGAGDLELAIGLQERAAIAGALPALCAAAADAVAGLTLRAADGRCTGALDVARSSPAAALWLGERLAVAAWTDESGLRVRFGDGPMDGAASGAARARRAEGVGGLAAGEWNLALWTRGLGQLPAPGRGPGAAARAQLEDIAAIVEWLALIDEVALGVAVRDSGVHVTLGVETRAARPVAEVRAHGAALAALVERGEAPQRGTGPAGGTRLAVGVAAATHAVVAPILAARSRARALLRAFGPPEAADLAGYVDDLPGDGPLVASFVTSQGTIRCELTAEQTPRTVANFVGLARGRKPFRDPASKEIVARPFYDGLVFHRVIPKFMIQGGDPLGQGTGGPGYKFDDEPDGALRFDRPGILAMANAGPGTNGSQFFITETAAPWLDGRHTAFGTCDDLDVIERIARVPRDRRDKPVDPVVIERVEIARRK